MDILISRQATLQLSNIYSYVSQEFGFIVAQETFDETISRIQLLKDNPRLGKIRFKKLRNRCIRQLTSKHNYILYTEIGNTIHIISIFDTRVSPKRINQNIKLYLSQIDN